MTGTGAPYPAIPRFAGAAALAHITLRLPEPWKEAGGQVYALAAGASGKDAAEDLPHVDLKDAADEVLLPLPREGHWDVGYVGPFGHVLVPDVEIVGTTDVRIEAGTARPIRFRLTGSRPFPKGGKIHVSAEDAIVYPGRGQCANFGFEVDLEAIDRIETPPVELGALLHLRVTTPTQALAPEGLPGAEWVLGREQARGGEEVELWARALGLVRFHLRLAAPLPDTWTSDWKTDVFVWAGARAPGEAEAQHGAGTTIDKKGVLKQSVVPVVLPPGRYELVVGPSRWWLPSPGAAPWIDLAAGQILDVEFPLQPDASAPSKPSSARSSIEHTLVLRPSPAPQGTWEFEAEVQVEGVVEWRSYGVGLDEESRMVFESSDTMHRGLLWRWPDLASAEFVPARSGGVDVPMLPAGFLVLVPDLIPDEALGMLRVRRLDGLPLPVVQGESGNASGMRVEPAPQVAMGVRLGPLVEGPIELEVLLGGVAIGRAKADVRAGKYTPLSIPLSGSAVR